MHVELCAVRSATPLLGKLQCATRFLSAASFESLRIALHYAFFSALLPVLQSHYSGTVAPSVSGSVAELSAASSALLALIRAAEDSITAVLRKSVDTFMTQVRRSAAEQVTLSYCS
jgi:hypothetical protein